ncbi:transglycosylase SLT domain-containing protein [Flavobacteriales bacterium]|jgi:hypothetical protein|nr:transglycosylase SLT domain-containing protein [Flavobacteriales bacterium]MDG1176166.1 transglycosylase SLT domain-containing protein [Flavobacteriales bacterium]|tara:strand:+ start:1263 stop:2237 length:975 start_codon:yes stop_codon:yes gene_type:complete
MKGKNYILLLFMSVWLQTKAQYNYNVVEVAHLGDTITSYFVPDEQIATERWDVLAQPNFWKKVMALSPDSCIINVAETRQILEYASFIDWKSQTEEEKDSVRDVIRWMNGLDSNTSLYVTSGKNHFYDFERVIPSLSKGIEIFEQQGVNPWYAQTILLIESPGKVQYSNVGAYGPFQLMKSVARTYGLTVNKRVDERKDFEKSAIGASKLLKYSCIPNAKKILDRNNVDYNEDDLWFKLFVLHIYHAGAGNVGGLIDNMKPDYGGMWLITDMWQTEFGGFKNASQNYSQVALASNIILEEIIYRKCEYILPCTPEISQISNSNE